MPRGRRVLLPTPAWFEHVDVGSVIQHIGGGRPRIVRKVSRWGGELRFVTVTIRHRSWTDRCYTLLDRAQLRSYRLLPFKFKMKGPSERLHQKIVAAINQAATNCHEPYILTARDVTGID